MKQHNTYLLTLICFWNLLIVTGLTAQESAQDTEGLTAGETELSASDLSLQEIYSAVDADFYDKALSLIKAGAEDYPRDYRFPMSLGDLYEEQELYSLALDSYRKAESLDMDKSVELRTSLASTLAYLDQNFESLVYLESLVDEGETALLDDLGWMYFKTHQPEKGILRLRESLNNGFDRNLSLTLGTLYSEQNNPSLCRKYYLDAIMDALDDQDSYFASVGYYNLSLAEKSFYDYDAAHDYAVKSLELMDRAAGHLALGDLYMMKQSYIDAEREFRDAVNLDKTPLSRSNLASLFQVQGRLEESLMEIKKIENEHDESWMYYYGLNEDQFVMDLYRQFYQIYEGMVQQVLLFKEWGFSDRFRRLIRLAEYRGKALYYRTLYRVLSYREGRSQLEGGSELRGSLTLASGAEGFSRQSVKYYLKALDLEGFPQALPWYDLMIGQELRDRDRLLRGEQGLDPQWERQPLEDVRRNRILLMRRDYPGKNNTLMSLYENNPGSLLQYGLRLPVKLHLSGERVSAVQLRRIKKLLKKSGFQLVPEHGTGLALRISLSDSIQYTMSDPEGTVLLSGNTLIESDLPEALKDWIRSFRNQAFQF